MNIIFNVSGGLGKTIMATVLAQVIRKKYKKCNLIVVTPFPDVFLHNPHINRCVKPGEQNRLYNEYIKNQECKIFVSDPYHTSDFITSKKHLYNIWCEIYGLKYEGQLPQLFITQSEFDYYKTVYVTEKPILALQTNGGGEGQPQPYNWSRDLPNPTVYEIINKFKDEYTICHIKRKDQPSYENTLQAVDSFRSIAVLLALSKKRIFIDSFAQHLAAALKLPSVVCWVTTSPDVFGYPLHNNTKSNSFTLNPQYDHPNYIAFNLVEDLKTIPYAKLEDIFDDESIIKNTLSL